MHAQVLIRTCKSCHHSKLEEQFGHMGLHCHGGPPAMVAVPQPGGLQVLSCWPPVTDTMHCAAWLEAPDQRQALQA